MDELDAAADKLLDMNPGAIPKFILLSEFKGLDKSDPEHKSAYEKVCLHPFVAEILRAQNERGFWPPFHGYTERIIKRLLCLGVKKDHPSLLSAAGYLKKVLNGAEGWDQYEKHDNPRWWTDMFVPLVSAAMLSLIDENAEEAVKQRRIWSGFAGAAFAVGRYDGEAEAKAQREFFGFATKRPVAAYGYYNLLLLTPQNGGGFLDNAADEALAGYCLNEAERLYYVYNSKIGEPVQIDVKRRDNRDFCHWLRALGIVSRLEGWGKHREKYVDWVMDQRNSEGLWELPKKPDMHCFPLSDSWRGKYNGMIDSSIMVMRILKGIHLF